MLPESIRSRNVSRWSHLGRRTDLKDVRPASDAINLQTTRVRQMKKTIKNGPISVSLPSPVASQRSKHSNKGGKIAANISMSVPNCRRRRTL
jgi:hypothetical protein